MELFTEIHSHARDVHGMDDVPPEVVAAIKGVITDV
jgi:predicted small metal-binding protein